MRLEIDNRRRKISIKFYTLGFGILYASFWKIVTFRFTDYTIESPLIRKLLRALPFWACGR